jgi:glutathione S-transferase
MGVIDRIVRGFTFISRAYEPDDEIHLVGFSRGAYTVRALAGMIAQVGLLDRSKYDVTDKRHAYQLGIAAWCKAKRASLSMGGLSMVANAMLTFLEGAVAAELPDRMLIRDVEITSVAVWDTVGSLGIPRYADNERLDVLRFTDSALSPKVARGFHAMAIDELRIDFPVAKWDARAGVEQVWFVGAHGDVGGGYPSIECYLSDIAFDWMMRKLAGVGVRFETPLMHTPDPRVLGGPFHTPWSTPPFNLQAPSPRRVETGDVLHATVRERWNSAVPSAYRPDALAAFAAGGIAGFMFDPAS